MYMYYLICSLTYDIDLIFLQDIRREVLGSHHSIARYNNDEICQVTLELYYLHKFEKRTNSFLLLYIKEYQHFHNHVSKTSNTHCPQRH